uniref:Uncharacterized protein n=1 Tax=Arundo donax TaxID=35708 RepID=A0A0A9B8A8_ARUDO
MSLNPFSILQFCFIWSEEPNGSHLVQSVLLCYLPPLCQLRARPRPASSVDGPLPTPLFNGTAIITSWLGTVGIGPALSFSVLDTSGWDIGLS